MRAARECGARRPWNEVCRCCCLRERRRYRRRLRLRGLWREQLLAPPWRTRGVGQYHGAIRQGKESRPLLKRARRTRCLRHEEFRRGAARRKRGSVSWPERENTTEQLDLAACLFGDRCRRMRGD